MSTAMKDRGEGATKRDEGGPGSSHQGGGHGRAHRARDGDAPDPGAPTNTTRSGASGGGG